MKKLLLTIVASILCAGSVSAQTIIGDSIIVESKKGSLAKMLKKWNYTNVRKIKVIGELGEKDMEALQTTSFRTLFTTIDLSDVSYAGQPELYSYRSKDKYMKCEFLVPSKTTLLKMFKTGRHKGKQIGLQLELKGNENTSHTIVVSGNSTLKLDFGSRDKTSSILKIRFYDRIEDNSILCRNKGGMRWGGQWVDIWEVPDYSFVNRNGILGNTDFNYCVLHDLSNDNVYIKKWKSNYSSFYLENAVEIESFSFSDTRLPNSVSFKKLKTIPKYTFTESGASEIHLKIVKEIDNYAFYGTNVKNIVLPASISHLNRYALNNLRTVEFEGTTPPTFDAIADDLKGMKDMCFIVPKGSLKNYKFGMWGSLRVREKGYNPNATIHCNKPGTFETFLTDDIINNTDSLIVTGTIYDTEKDLVKKIKWLKNTDWSGVSIVKSPQTLAAEQKAEQERLQRERDRPKREAAARRLSQERDRHGVGTTSEGYRIGYNDGYRCVNCYLNYEMSMNPLYSNAFLYGYMQGFQRGQDAHMQDELMKMRR